MANDGIQLPSTFAGITRFKEEYHSKIRFSPIVVIGFVIVIVALVILLRMFYPVVV